MIIVFYIVLSFLLETCGNNTLALVRGVQSMKYVQYNIQTIDIKNFDTIFPLDIAQK